MVASSLLLALFATLVAAGSADYVCGDNKQFKKSQRSGDLGLNYGENTSPLENPWLVQLVYANDKKRACAGSLVSDRHVLTARQCVDGVEPEDISVLYGPRTPYGGHMKVKSAKSPTEPKADLAVLELVKAVEYSQDTIPVCVAGTFNEKDYGDYKGLHYGPKNKSQDDELTRGMFQDVLYGKDDEECAKALGKNFHKDSQFCVGKRNMVFADGGVYTGAPILALHSSKRYVQVGIAIKADKENNYGSATRVTLYQKEISELAGESLPSIESKPPGEPIRDSKYPRLVRLPEQHTFEEAEKACLKLRGTVAAPTEPKFEEYLKGLSQRGLYWALYSDPLGNNTKNEKYLDCYAIDTSHKDSEGHYKKITKGCNSELPVVCSVADDKKCNGKKALYFNGYCYKITGGSKEVNAADSEKACEKDGAKLASVHTAGENHAIRLLFGDVFPTGDDACVRLGFSLIVNKNNTKLGRGKVSDGSSFDFGFQQCNEEGRYPWCPVEPWCDGYSSVVITQNYQEGKRCWYADTDKNKCPALCKNKLE